MPGSEETMTHRRHLLSAAAIALGAFVTSECARLASAGHEADEREARGAELEELHAALADLHSDDAKTREDAQERILALGYSFDDDVAVALATTRSLEVKARLTEVLDRWNQLAFEDALLQLSLRRSRVPWEHVRTCPVCLSQTYGIPNTTLMQVSSTSTTTSTTSGVPRGSTGASSSSSGPFCGSGFFGE